jgi:hypothetical protein
VAYPVGDTSYLFVAHNARLANGETPEILYTKLNPSEARLYTVWTWIDFGVLVPAFLISILVFQIVWVLSHHFQKEEVEILPSNL